MDPFVWFCQKENPVPEGHVNASELIISIIGSLTVIRLLQSHKRAECGGTLSAVMDGLWTSTLNHIFIFLLKLVHTAVTASELHSRRHNWALALCFSPPANGLSSTRGAIHHMHYLKSGASIKIRTVKRRWMALVCTRHHPQIPKLNLEILQGRLD